MADSMFPRRLIMVTHLSSHFDYAAAEYETVPCNLCGRPDYLLLARRDQHGLPVRTCLCKNCGFMYVSPRMTWAWYERYYARAYRIERAKPGSSAASPTFAFDKGQRFGRALARLIQPHILPGLTIEVGSSSGGVLAGFQSVLPAIEPFGIEPSPDEAAYAEGHGIPTRRALLEEFAEPMAPAANIVCVRSLNHLLDPRRFLTWAHGALAPGGKLILAVLDFRHSAKKRGSVRRAAQIDHVSMFTAETLRAFVTAAGFDIKFMDVNESKPIPVLLARRGSGLTGQHLRRVAKRAERAPFADLTPAAGLGPKIAASMRAHRLIAYWVAFCAWRLWWRIRGRLRRMAASSRACVA